MRYIQGRQTLPQRRRYNPPRTTRSRKRPRRNKSRALSKWQKFVKTNSKKKEFRYRNGKINLKKLGVAYRKKHGKRKR